MDDNVFTTVLERAYAELPAELRSRIDNVVITVEPEPPDGDERFGQYTGIPLTERTSSYMAQVPDRIEIYQGPLERVFGGDIHELRRQVRITLLHEIGHYFGMSEQQLHDRGWA